MSITVSVRCTNYATAPLKSVGQKIPVTHGAFMGGKIGTITGSPVIMSEYEPPSRLEWERKSLRDLRRQRWCMLAIAVIEFALGSRLAMPCLGLLIGVFMMNLRASQVARQLREHELEEAIGCGDLPRAPRIASVGVSVADLAKLHSAMKQAGQSADQFTTSLKALRRATR